MKKRDGVIELMKNEIASPASSTTPLKSNFREKQSRKRSEITTTISDHDTNTLLHPYKKSKQAKNTNLIKKKE